MNDGRGWSRIEREARGAFRGAGRFPIRAYSEFMPAPFVGIKPYEPDRGRAPCTGSATEDVFFDLSEYDLAQEIEPGLDRVAEHVHAELRKLVRGEAHALSRTLLADNPAWPEDLAAAARDGKLAARPLALAMPIALSRSQDDKGNARWTLFGASEEGASSAFWRSFGDGDEARLSRVLRWALGHHAASMEGVRIFSLGEEELPAFLRARKLGDALGDTRVVVSFAPFSRLPAAVREAYLAGRCELFPSPASLVFFEHPRYRKLARTLPRAMQIPLLHLFPRIEGSCTLRVPQSGWLDEHDPSQRTHDHRVVSRVVRTHRWERVARDEDLRGDGKFTDDVTVALFSTDPDELELYGKPMARNVQIWSEDYELVLDGPRADKDAIDRAAKITDAGGRFGYRFYFPPMRGGTREIVWHLPLVARANEEGRVERLARDAPLGHVTADPADGFPGEGRLVLSPRPLARPGHVDAANAFARDPGRARFTTSHNARKLLEMRELLGAPLSPSFARALLHVSRELALDGWLERLPDLATDRAAGERLATTLRACVGSEADAGAGLTFARTATRPFEEEVWRSIADLAEGAWTQKENADGIAVNRGKTGGPAARAAKVHVAERRDLERLGDHLHARHAALVAEHGMTGRAEVVDHVFRWETDFSYPWMHGWQKNQTGEGRERNVVLVIPGRNRGEAVVMADHYDTAYMEDVYDAERGGDGLRAPAAGADDNHSATTALLRAADVLLPMARDGLLERDVWLVHLTGEEFPADSLGARALAQALVEESLVFTAEDGSARDVSRVRCVGVYVLDMIGHNTERDRDVFQIAPGEGAASARLALAAHRANVRWNAATRAWNGAPDRRGKGRARRMPDGKSPPPDFAHLALHGEIRTEWEPRSALYNTDGQVFSDVGVPVVLFMENYDISRTGYHDTHDTMANIDLDYCAALTAIAIEAVAELACAPKV